MTTRSRRRRHGAVRREIRRHRARAGYPASRELCGGTHVSRTGDIGLFKIVSEGGVAAGVRRVEAITGDNALAWVQNQNALLTQVAGMLRSTPADLPARIAQVQDQVKALEKTWSSAASWPPAPATTWRQRRGRGQGHQGPGRQHRRRRSQGPARHGRQPQGSPEARGCAAGDRCRRQDQRGGRRHGRPDRPRQAGDLVASWPARWAARAADVRTWPWAAVPTRVLPAAIASVQKWVEERL